MRQGKGAVTSIFLDIEIIGVESDCCKMRTTTVRKLMHANLGKEKLIIKLVVGDNGFNPVWNEQTQFIVSNPDVALIQFLVQDEDVFGDPNFLAQAVYPVNSLKTGYRSVQLKNQFSEEMELSSLLIHLDVRRMKEGNEDLYSTITHLREQLMDISKEISTVTSLNTGNQYEAAQQLTDLTERMQTTQSELKRLTESR